MNQANINQANTKPSKIVILGAPGRMGRQLLTLASDDPSWQLWGATAREGDARLGQDIGALLGCSNQGVSLQPLDEKLLRSAEVVVDFTLPDASLHHAKLLSESQTPWVLGTTGFGADIQKEIEKAAQKIPVLQAANFSLGVNLLLSLVKQAAARLSSSWDIEILDMHHNQKRDAPSGTALALGQAAALGRGQSLDEQSYESRKEDRQPRPQGKIGFAALRGGAVVGEHDVIFASPFERLILSHKADNRAVFAQGALHAAHWLKDKPAGLYSMADMLAIEA